jgi:predicted ester cyclase
MSEDVQANKAQSRRLYEQVFGAGNYDVADSIMAADVITHGPGSPPAGGTEGLKRQARLLRTAFPDLRVTLNNQLGEGDRVASHWTGSGTHSGPLNLPTGTVEPTGTSIAFDEMRIDGFADGRIVESWLIPDRMTLWQQLGLFPAPSGMGGVDAPHR